MRKHFEKVSSDHLHKTHLHHHIFFCSLCVQVQSSGRVLIKSRTPSSSISTLRVLANPVQEATDSGEVDGAADAALQAVRDDAVLQPLAGLLLRTDEGATFK